MSPRARGFATGLMIVGAAFCLADVAPAAGPIRIGAAVAQTGVYAALGHNQRRGYQLCIKHVNERGGVLGRRVVLIVHDDRSEPATAVRLYEQLVSQERVDLILGPYSSPITDAVADVSESHRTPMVAPTAALGSIYAKGRKFVFGMLPSADGRLEGLLDLAARNGLKTVAVINVDDSARRAGARGTVELARKKGLQVLYTETYRPETTDFAAILTKVHAANPDVLIGSTRFHDAVAITRQMKMSNVNPRMYGLTVGVDSLEFYQRLGRDAEFVYGVSPWLPELVDVRAGGLIPIARQYPGAREFVESYRREFPGADLSYHAAAGYGGCEILVEAIRRAGNLDGEKLREAILKIDRSTVFGAFAVAPNGAPIARKDLVFQWQDGRKVIVWPDELAPGKPRFPTPPWSQRQ